MNFNLTSALIISFNIGILTTLCATGPIVSKLTPAKVLNCTQTHASLYHTSTRVEMPVDIKKLTLSMCEKIYR